MPALQLVPGECIHCIVGSGPANSPQRPDLDRSKVTATDIRSKTPIYIGRAAAAVLQEAADDPGGQTGLERVPVCLEDDASYRVFESALASL
jgi:hypothetical protein